MAVKKEPFSSILAKDAGGATDVLLGEVVKPGYISCVQHVAFMNKTSTSTRMRIAVRSGARDVLVAEENTLTADKLYWYDVSFYITEGQRLAVLLTGLTTGDDIEAHVLGWHQARSEGV